jgi:excinuclease UvrABC nuclease subunit
MKLQVAWSDPVGMRLASRHSPVYRVELDNLTAEAGIYVFGRKWGGDFEALYVGKASNSRRRLKGQLNNLRLMQHIREAKSR